MMTGTVTSRLDPVIQCFLQNAKGESVPVNFLINTGFNGYLALPPLWIQRLSLVAEEEKGTLTLADASTVPSVFYRGLILWEEKEREVIVLELDGDPLIGTALPYAFRLIIDFENGGNVMLERIASLIGA